MFDEIISLDHSDKKVNGTKAVNLSVLRKNNIPVPDGCIYTIQDPLLNYQRVFEECTKLIKTPYIVRSSFAIEDGDILSFAGIFESVANINSQDEFQEAIKKIVNTATSEKLKTYANNYNIDFSNLKPIILIQEYKTSILSGVVFTEKPNDPDSLIIEYSTQKEGITAGNSNASQVVTNKQDRNICTHSNTQGLSEKEIAILVEYSLKIENIFKHPQDIEWLFDGEKIWILQSRNITTSITDKIVDQTVNSLKQTFGEPTPLFTRKLFAEEIEYITPITLSLFKRFYSKSGAFGTTMKKLWMPIKDFDENKYVVDIFSKPYINETLEKEIFGSSYKQPINQVLLAYFKELLKRPLAILGITGNFFRVLFSQIILQVKLFVLYRKIDSDIAQTISQVTSRINNASTQEKLLSTLSILENVLVPKLFLINLFQEYLYNYLKRNLQKEISDEEWNSFIKVHKKIILQEKNIVNVFELSTSRTDFYVSEKYTLEKNNNREIILERYQDIWTRQILSLYAEMYDSFSLAREVLHNELIKLFNELHSELLVLDRENSLYNSIWYATIDDVIKDVSKLNRVDLFQKKQTSEFLRKINISTTIQLEKWTVLIEPGKAFSTASIIKGEMLSTGSAQGMICTKDTVNKESSTQCILITEHIDPGIVALYSKIKGVITLTGGELSHAAILAREFGIPIIKINSYPKNYEGSHVFIDGKNKKLILEE